MMSRDKAMQTDMEICPWCNGPLRKGAIQARRAIHWNQTPKSRFWGELGLELFARTLGYNLDALLCLKCNKIIVVLHEDLGNKILGYEKRERDYLKNFWTGGVSYDDPDD